MTDECLRVSGDPPPCCRRSDDQTCAGMFQINHQLLLLLMRAAEKREREMEGGVEVCVQSQPGGSSFLSEFFKAAAVLKMLCRRWDVSNTFWGLNLAERAGLRWSRRGKKLQRSIFVV